ncbi:MAG: hypothetical protein PHO83_02405 [Geobacteraceae bacterium]|nr:hypothetical protein [Geobacteraceae bacterium]
MENNGYRIVLLGIQPDNDHDVVKKKLAQAFRVSPEKIEQRLAKFPLLVKSGVDYQAAMKCRKILENAGCACRIEPMKDASGAQSPPPKIAPAIKTCPNCGYNATTADDPLLTAYDGLGECPACGIIVAKFSRNIPSENETVPPVLKQAEEKLLVRKDAGLSVLFRPVTLLLSAAAVCFVVIFLYNREPHQASDQDAPAQSITARQGQAETGKETAQNNSSVQKILPGETANLVLTTYLDFLHRDTFSPLSITPRGSVDNTWEEEGVRVEIVNVVVAPVSVSLWEHLREKDNHWVPAGYKGISSQGGANGAIEKSKNLLVTPYPAALVKKPEETSQKIDAADPNFRKSSYTMYRVEYELSISVPSGPEFGSRDLTVTTEAGKTVPRIAREGNVCISTFVTWDLDSNAEALGSFSQAGAWQATKAAVLRNKKVCLAMKHATRTEGIMIAPREKYCESPGYCELDAL